MQNSQLAARETAKDDVLKEVVPKKQTKELEKADFTNNDNDRVMIAERRKREMDKHRAAAEAAHEHEKWGEQERAAVSERHAVKEEQRESAPSGYLDFDEQMESATHRAQQYNSTLPEAPAKEDNGREYNDGTPFEEHLYRGGGY